MPELTERANLYVWLVVREKTRENATDLLTHIVNENKNKRIIIMVILLSVIFFLGFCCLVSDRPRINLKYHRQLDHSTQNTIDTEKKCIFPRFSVD